MRMMLGVVMTGMRCEMKHGASNTKRSWWIQVKDRRRWNKQLTKARLQTVNSWPEVFMFLDRQPSTGHSRLGLTYGLSRQYRIQTL